MKKKVESSRISYESYAYLRALVEKDIANLEREYHIACAFLSKPQSLSDAHKNFMLSLRPRKIAFESLHVAASAMYKDHPNPEMRKFWCLE